MYLWLKESNLGVFLICAVVIFIIFGNTLNNGFVYDDHFLITENKFIKDFAYLDDFFSHDIFMSASHGYYRPLSMVFLAIMYKIWGLNPAGFHLCNILLHLINTFLVFLLLREISGDRMLAFIGALVFAVHPVHVEAVAPIYNFMGLLSGFFALAAFLAFVKSRGLKKKNYVLLSLAMLAMGLLCKEDIFALPLIFILYDLYFISRFSLKNVLKKWKVCILFFAVNGLYLLARSLIIESGATMGLGNTNVYFNITPSTNIGSHIFTVIKTYYYYVVLLVFPIKLSAFHIIPSVSALVNLEVFISTIFILAFIFAAFYYRKRNPLVSFFIFLFFLSSLLISNIIPIGGLFAERFMYFPSISYCFFAGFIFSRALKQYQDPAYDKRKKLTILILFIILSLYAVKAVSRNYIWRNDISLWKDTAEKSPGFVPHFQLGNAYFKLKSYDAALREFNAALPLSGCTGREHKIRNMIGKIYGIKGIYDGALKEFQKAVRLNNHVVEPYYNIGITYFNKGDLESAILYFQKAIEIDKTYPWSYYGIGLVYEKKNEVPEAREMLMRALELDPDFVLAEDALKRIDQ